MSDNKQMPSLKEEKKTTSDPRNHGQRKIKKIHEILDVKYLLSDLVNIVCEYGIPTYQKWTMGSSNDDSHLATSRMKYMAMTPTHVFISVINKEEKWSIAVYTHQMNKFSYVCEMARGLFHSNLCAQHLCVVQNKLIVCDDASDHNVSSKKDDHTVGLRLSQILVFDLSTPEEVWPLQTPTYFSVNNVIGICNVNERLYLATSSSVDLKITIVMISDVMNFNNQQFIQQSGSLITVLTHHSFSISQLGPRRIITSDGQWVKWFNLTCKDDLCFQESEDVCVIANTLPIIGHANATPNGIKGPIQSVVGHEDDCFVVSTNSIIWKYSLSHPQWSDPIYISQQKFQIHALFLSPTHLICLDSRSIQWFPRALFNYLYLH